ncbi:hypothetical protein M9H77_31037 [Catharanthus roseus]|uniref:Uncharacterized protein n=1 Tax=Catharanthus roseus TaxID=4058 RepID=A0ACC0A006_CATRO|nr:hypothetical protein M9H77_31037 [Catharanthus roseus]
MKTNKNNKPKSITKYLLHEIFFLHGFLLQLEHSEHQEAYLSPWRPIQRRVALAWSTSSGRQGAGERNTAAAVKGGRLRRQSLFLSHLSALSHSSSTKTTRCAKRRRRAEK